MIKISHICMQVVGTAHKCRNCHNNILIFCGIRTGEKVVDKKLFAPIVQKSKVGYTAKMYQTLLLENVMKNM